VTGRAAFAGLRPVPERRPTVADAETSEMPSGKMVEPPKGKGKKKPGEMPAGEMQTPPPDAKKDGKR
jgi:hypothetical protein